jgi:hypothetical protein
MEKEKFAVGNVVRSWKFACGYLDYESIFGSGTIFVDGKNGCLRCGIRQDAYRDAYDESRGKADFVIEQSYAASGDSVRQGGTSVPDGLQIHARRLWKNGHYSPKGEVIVFATSNAFRHYIPAEDVEFVRKMKVGFK